MAAWRGQSGGIEFDNTIGHSGVSVMPVLTG
jgi:hypothetical protein